MTKEEKNLGARCVGRFGPCRELSADYLLARLEKDPNYYLIEKKDPIFSKPSSQEAIFFWIPAGEDNFSETLVDALRQDVPSIPLEKIRLVTRTLRYQPPGTSIGVEVDPRFVNESVCVVKQMKPPRNAQTRYEGIDPVWSLLVKHRDSGPKEYLLAFTPDLEEIQEDWLVRVFWVSSVASSTGWALRINVIGEVTYC